MIAATAVATQLSTIIQYNTIQYNTIQCTMYNGGQKGEVGYAESRWTLDSLMISTILNSVGRSIFPLYAS